MWEARAYGMESQTKYKGENELSINSYFSLLPTTGCNMSICLMPHCHSLHHCWNLISMLWYYPDKKKVKGERFCCWSQYRAAVYYNVEYHRYRSLRDLVTVYLRSRMEREWMHVFLLCSVSSLNLHTTGHKPREWFHPPWQFFHLSEHNQDKLPKTHPQAQLS